jgi:hypothetical protein
LDLAKAIELVKAFGKIENLENIQVTNLSMFGKEYSLFIRKDLVNVFTLAKIEEVARNNGLSVTFSDSHCIIAEDGSC